MTLFGPTLNRVVVDAKIVIVGVSAQKALVIMIHQAARSSSEIEIIHPLRSLVSFGEAVQILRGLIPVPQSVKRCRNWRSTVNHGKIMFLIRHEVGGLLQGQVGIDCGEAYCR